MALVGNVNRPANGPAWILIVFPICHVAVGVGRTYFILAGFFNATRVLVDGDFVHVRHRPIPWWGNRDAERSLIQAIEVDTAMLENGTPRVPVSANQADGRQIVLVSNVSKMQGRYIGYTLAEYLGVECADHSNGGSTFILPAWIRRWIKGQKSSVR